MKQKKISHVIFSFQVGGTENMLVDIINEQVKNNIVQLIIIKDIVDKKMESALSNKVELIKLNQPLRLNKIRVLTSLWWQLIRFKPQLVHVHQQNALGFFPKKLSALRSFRLISTVHDTGIECDYFENADKIFAISNSVKTDIEDRYPLKTVINLNGINFSNINHKNSYKLEGKIKIVQISRLMHSKKGQDILIKAISPLLSSYDIEIHFIGDGESFDYLNSLVAELDMMDNVKFHGSISKSDVYKLLPQFDLLVQPSIYEGFGLTVVEAMAAKIPVLVSNVEGPMEVIQNGEYGFSFQSENVKDCENQIKKIIQEYHMEKVDDLSEKAFKYALESFDIKRTSAKYAEQ